MKPLWSCRRCGRTFANRNQVHVCARVPLRDYLRGKPRPVVALCRKFLAAARAAAAGGPVRIVVQKTGITLQGRVSFAYVRVLRDCLGVAVLLPQPVEHPRFTKIQTASRRCHLHHFAIRFANEIDQDVRTWLREAYRVGRQLHLLERGGWQWSDELPAAATTSQRTVRLKPRPLWRCPKCRKYYVTRNIWHACARHTEAEHLRGKSEMAVWLYRRIVRMLRECGPLRIVPGKTGIAFQVRMRFAGVHIRKNGVRLGFLLTRGLAHPRITQVHAYTPRCHGHHVHLSAPEDLNTELESWLRESYRVGQQADLLAQR